MSNVPITFGSGQASIAGDTVGATTYQQIKIQDGTIGGTTGLIVNADGTLNARISGSVLSAGSTFNGSVSGTVGASVIGVVPVQLSNSSVIALIQGSVAVAGTVTAVASGNQSVSGTVGASIIGTVPVTQGGPINASVSGTVGASIIGTVPVNIVAGGSTGSVAANIQGSIAAVIIGGSIAASFTPPANQSVSGTVQTDVRSSVAVVIIGGSIAASFTPPANQSVSGTVGASVIGQVPVFIIGGSIAASFTPPANQSVSGTVQTDVRSSVAVVIIGGSIAASFTPPANQSVSGAVSISNFPTTQNVSGSVVATQGTTPWIITGSVQGVFAGVANQSVSGTVGSSIIGTVPVTQSGTNITSLVSTVPSSVIVGASIFGTAPVTQAGTWIASVFGTVSVIGTVPVTQSTSPWIITGSVQASITPAANQSVSGTVGASIIGTVPVTISGAIQSSVQGVVQVSSLLVMPGIVSTTNSTATPVTSTLSFTGTGEEWKDFGSIVLNVFTDASSATDGLSIQQSSDNTNWDIRDTYTVTSMAAGQGKTFQVQPAARFGRVVYTQGAVNSGAFRLQTIYHPQMVKPTSQRPNDSYSNETDTEQNQTFNMVLNEGGTWDRLRGNSSVGARVSTGNTSVLTIWQAASIAGTYVEDLVHTTGDRGIFVLGVRNDTLSSVTSTDGDYSYHAVGPVGETITANSPLTKWVQGTADFRQGNAGASIVAIAAQGASIFTYITAVQVVNMGSASVLVSLQGTGSTLGYTIAPAGGGSNIYYPNGLKTPANGTFAASLSGIASVLVSAQGFISKI